MRSARRLHAHVDALRSNKSQDIAPHIPNSLYRLDVPMKFVAGRPTTSSNMAPTSLRLECMSGKPILCRAGPVTPKRCKRHSGLHGSMRCSCGCVLTCMASGTLLLFWRVWCMWCVCRRLFKRTFCWLTYWLLLDAVCKNSDTAPQNEI